MFLRKYAITHFFSQLVRFANICSNFAGFAERVKLVFNKLLARKYDKELLKRTFHKFACQYSDCARFYS